MNYGLTFSAHDESKKETNLKRIENAPVEFLYGTERDQPRRHAVDGHVSFN